MNELEYILKICYYFFIILVIFIISKKHQKSSDKFPVLLMLFVCLLYGIFSIVCGKYPYVSDRLNYAFRFSSDYYSSFVQSDSFGLFYLSKIIHLFTYEPKILFFVVSFLVMTITLFAYKNNNEAEPKSLLFLLLSAYPTYGLYLLKQSLSISLVYLALSYRKKNKIKMWILLLLSILFHEAALIVLPILFVLKLLKKDTLKGTIYIIFTILLFTFAKYNSLLISAVIKIVPSLSNQLNYYINSSTGVMVSNGTDMAFLKGLPFFTIFIVGLFKKKELSSKIKGYNEYIFLTFFVITTFLLSNYMYWIFRFGIYFYFPIFIFGVELLKSIKKPRNKLLYLTMTYGIFLILSIRLWYQYFFLYGGL